MKNYGYELQLSCHKTAVNNIKAHDVQVCLQYINKMFPKTSWVVVHYRNVKYMKNFQILKIRTCTYLQKQIFFFLTS